MILRSRLERDIELRAASRCEYCLMHQSLQGGTFHIEHVIPSSRGGASTAENLALACPSCNLKKSNRIGAIDPQTGNEIVLFNPRAEHWDGHFLWDGYRVVARTATGRATADLLDLNHPRRIRIRRAEEMFGLFPLPDE